MCTTCHGGRVPHERKGGTHVPLRLRVRKAAGEGWLEGNVGSGGGGRTVQDKLGDRASGGPVSRHGGKQKREFRRGEMKRIVSRGGNERTVAGTETGQVVRGGNGAQNGRREGSEALQTSRTPTEGGRPGART